MVRGTRPPPPRQSKFFQFHAFFGKFAKYMLAPPWSGNPGSTKSYLIQFWRISEKSKFHVNEIMRHHDTISSSNDLGYPKQNNIYLPTNMFLTSFCRFSRKDKVPIVRCGHIVVVVVISVSGFPGNSHVDVWALTLYLWGQGLSKVNKNNSWLFVRKYLLTSCRVSHLSLWTQVRQTLLSLTVADPSES